MLGDTDHPEYFPHRSLKYTNQMSLLERVFNTFLLHLTTWTDEQMKNDPTVLSVIQKVLPGCPPLKQIEKELSLILINSHPIFHYTQAKTPEMIDIGGIHCRAAQPLPSVCTNVPLSFNSTVF